ncbi:MAG TPA: phenylalanine--tRNA ligase subunit beta, partial [Gammaproteobacteria bacterium]|nr:phenylalanine--tRNA ligase subunit beta [Gammaproteobacteria bacterium]HCX13506.1 phenylalanine--tRNA ligase subunit beta [Gammaproteobacteria bacterium]
DFYDIKSDVESLLSLTTNTFTFKAAEHPALQKGQTAQILLNDNAVGWVGTLAPHAQKQLSLSKCYLFELDLASMQQGSVAKYQAFSAYQKAARDIALVIDENIPANDLINSIHSLNQTYLVDVNLFDVYAGENIESGKKSIALNLSYQSVDQTLSDDQVNAQVSEVLALMQTKFSATQR